MDTFFFFFLTEKWHFCPFPTNYGDKGFCVPVTQTLNMTKTNNCSEFFWSIQLNIKSLVQYKMTSCGYQGKSVVQLKALGNVIRKLIGLGEFKNYALLGCIQGWNMLRAAKKSGEHLDLQKIINTLSITVGATWTDASAFTRASALLLFLPLTQIIEKGIPVDCKILGVVGTHSLLPLSKCCNMISSLGLNSQLITYVGQYFLFFGFLLEKHLFFSEIWPLPFSELGASLIVFVQILHSDGYSCDRQPHRKGTHNV